MSGACDSQNNENASTEDSDRRAILLSQIVLNFACLLARSEIQIKYYILECVFDISVSISVSTNGSLCWTVVATNWAILSACMNVEFLHYFKPELRPRFAHEYPNVRKR